MMVLASDPDRTTASDGASISATDDQVQLSIIVPALNEEANLPRLFKSIARVLANVAVYEILVVDNGSTDKTIQLSRDCGARVLDSSGSIAYSRNYGAHEAQSEILVFLDADVELTAEWGSAIRETMGLIESEPNCVTGAWYRVRKEASPLERYWFGPLESGTHSHINAGNLLLAREKFLELGGFDESMVTGEDYEFTRRAMRLGCSIQENEQLAVIHHGYPTRLADFLRREVWHGLGDYRSLRSALASKVAVAAFLFVSLLLASLTGLALGRIALAGTLFGTALGIPLLASLSKYWRFGPLIVVVNTYFYGWYLLARFFAMLVSVSGGHWRSRHTVNNKRGN
jgi:glycosyltransferase involved in cell wall biosynthesis